MGHRGSGEREEAGRAARGLNARGYLSFTESGELRERDNDDSHRSAQVDVGPSGDQGGIAHHVPAGLAFHANHALRGSNKSILDGTVRETRERCEYGVSPSVSTT